MDGDREQLQNYSIFVIVGIINQDYSSSQLY